LTSAPTLPWRFSRKILIPMVVVMLAGVGIAGFGLYWATTRSDYVAVERQVQTTRRAIDDIIARLALEQETVAVWDDSASHLHRAHPDMTWINDNTGVWLHSIFGHDQTFILNGRDQPVYANIEGSMVAASRFEAIRNDLRLQLEETRGRRNAPNNRFDRHPGQARPGSAVLTTARAIHDTQIARVGGRPAAVSIMRIRASTPGLQPPGPEPLMVSLRYLDRGFLQELEHRNLIDGARFSPARDLGRGEQALVIENEDGGHIGYFIWRPVLPGSRILAVLAPTTAGLVIAMIALMALLGRWLKRSTGELGEALVQLQASEAQAQHLAFHDTLTGLPNRALFNDRLDHALSRARRGDGLTVLTLDLDRFKHVNDTLGHLAGDALIREFGSRVSALVREGDTVARPGGDEFAVLLPEMECRDQIEALCARILCAVHQPFEVLGNAAFVGVSIGVVSAPAAGLDRVELLRKADIALYRAKAEGRDCYRLFNEDMDERIRFLSEMEDDLRQALREGDQLRLYFQPEMGPDGHDIVGLEALLRWQHPRRGLVSPEQFIPVAEEAGLMGSLGEWVFKEACAASRRWPELFIAVNLSPVQFRDKDFPDQLIRMARDAKVDSVRLELEITEGVLLEDNETVRQALAKLRKSGFRIALDDFGTGYSSLSYLRKFEVDKIKIDRSFVQHLGNKVDSASLIEAVIMIGRAMGLTVTAEGVETNEQRHFLSMAGCNQMQGHLFSRALPASQVSRLLGSRSRMRAA